LDDGVMTLSPEEQTVVQGLAAPIAFDQRAAFMNAVAEAMAAQKVRGPGAAHRIAATIQQGFIKTSVQVTVEERRVAEALSRGKRLAATPAGVKDQSRARSLG
jgi:hypothetical protein